MAQAQSVDARNSSDLQNNKPVTAKRMKRMGYLSRTQRLTDRSVVRCDCVVSGGQDRSTGRRVRSGGHLRGGFPRLFVWIPTGARSARCAGRSPRRIYRKQVNWVLDSDIQGFFDAMAHSWTIRFLEHRIADKRILRLIAKWLKVGIREDGRVTRSERGTPQGAVISPILANVYLHYVYDLWTHRWRRKATGDVIVIRYADDTIVGFQHEHEAKAFLRDLHERMREFELALHPAKTRLIRFGRHAAKQREELGEGRPEPFDFLGFTHFCTRSRKWGSFVIGRKTIKKRMLKKLQEVKMELRKRMHDPIAKTGAWLKRMLKGHLNYYAVSGNSPSLWWYFNEVRWRWLKSLKRRSQRAFMSWEKFTSATDRFFPSIRILHPLPCHRFDARTRGKSPVR